MTLDNTEPTSNSECKYIEEKSPRVETNGPHQQGYAHAPMIKWGKEKMITKNHGRTKVYQKDWKRSGHIVSAGRYEKLEAEIVIVFKIGLN